MMSGVAWRHVLVLIVLVGSAAAEDLVADWDWRTPLTIPAAKVGAAVTDFPILLTEANLPAEMLDADGVQDVLSGGGDLRFTTNPDGTGALACEVVTCTTGATPAVEVWVEVPALATGADTILYCWWGNAAAAQPAVTATNGRNAVWSNGFVAVWHLGEDAGGSAPQFTDSTGAGNHATAGNFADGAVTTGRIGTATLFDGSDDHAAVPHAAGFNQTTTLTLSAWAYPASLSDGRRILQKGNSDQQYRFRILDSGARFSSAGVAGATSAALATGTWQHLSATYDSAAIRIYVDGAQSATVAATEALPTSSDPFHIGAKSPTEVASTFFSGRLDEARFSSMARSAGWLLTEYTNQSDPATFAIAGTISAAAPATLYWHPQGGSTDPAVAGNWTTDQAGTVPATALAAEDLRFDGAGVTADGDCTMTAAFACGSLTFTGYTGTFSDGGFTLTTGSVACDAGMTLVATGTLTLRSAVAPLTLTSAGKQFAALSLQAEGGVTLADAASVASLSVESTASSTLSGSAITLRSGALARVDATGSAGDHTIACDVVLGADATWSIASTSGSLTVGGVISDGGAARTLTKTGAGLLVLTGASTYGGATTVSAGTVRVGSDAIASTPGALGNGTAALILGGGTLEVAAAFSRSLSVTATGSRIDAYGTARTVSGAVSATGTYSLQVGGTEVSGAAGQTLTLSGAISNGTGTLALEKIGSNIVSLTGTNTYSGGTTISAGTLVVTTSSLPGNLVNHATVRFEQSVSGTYAGVISGSGSLTKTGSATVTLSAASTYTGNTTISAGTLRANASVIASTNGPFGNSADPIVLSGGRVQSNTATFSRPITVDAWGGSIDAYGSARTIASDISVVGRDGLIGSVYAGNLSSVTEDDWRTSRVRSGVRCDRVLNWDSTIFGSSGEWTDYGVGGASGSWTLVSFQWDGWIRIRTTGTNLFTRSDDGSRVWLDLDGDDVVDAGEWGANGWGIGQGATTRQVHGNLTAGLYRMRIQYAQGTSSGVFQLLWDDALHTDGTVDSRYRVPSDSLHGFCVGANTGASAAGQPLTLTGTISGTGGLTKIGNSTLILAAANTYAGQTTVAEGTLRQAIANAVPDTALQVDRIADLDLEGFDMTVGRLIGHGDILLSTGAFTFGGDGSSGTFSGRFEEAGTFTKAGAGTYTLDRDSSTTGAFTIAAGAIRATHALALGATGGGTTVAGGATLEIDGVAIGAEALSLSGTGIAGEGALTASGTASLSGAITLAAATRIAASGTFTLSGAIGGAHDLTTGGSGTIVLAASNGYSGASTIASGTVRLLGDAGAIAASSAVAIGAGAALEIDATGSSNPDRIGDAATVTMQGGTLTLTAPTDVTRTEAIGALAIAEGGNAITLTAAGTGNAQITAASVASRTAPGTLSLTRVDATGTANLFLTGTADATTVPWSTVTEGALTAIGQYRTATGLVVPTAGVTHTSIASGNWDAGSTWDTGSPPAAGDRVVVAGAHAISLNGADRTIAALSFSGSGSLTGANILTITTASLVATTGTPTIASPLAFGTGEIVARVASGGMLTVTGAVSGSNGLVKHGSGTLALGGANTFDGLTTVVAGTLAVAHADALGSAAAGTAVVGGATVRIDGIALAEPLTLRGAGVGGAGALLCATAGSATGAITLATDATVGAAADLTISGTISGSGGLTKTGSGTLILTGTNTYTGTTILDAGTVRVSSAVPDGASGAFGNASSAVVLAAALEVDTATFARPISVGAGGSSLIAHGAARTVSAAIDARDADAGGGLIASVVASSLQAVTEDDWRRTQTIVDTFAAAVIDHPDNAFGTPAERAAWGIGGTDGNWDDFSVQWDGYLVVRTDGTDLATRSDDGSRVWLDRDADGVVEASEWGSNSWGSGQPSTTRTVHSNLAAGTYRMRVQYEEEGGGNYNSMQLLWDDADHSAGTVDGRYVVPVTCLVSRQLLVGGATHDLTLSGVVSGTSDLLKTGAGTVTFSGANTLTGTLTVEAGTALVTGTQASSPVSLTGGTLAGTGTVGAITAADGTVSPGTDGGIGILTAASADFSGGGTLLIETPGRSSAGTDYDRLALGSGALTLGGTSVLIADLQDSFLTGAVTGVVACGSVVGTFTTVTYANAAGMEPTVGYAATRVDLALGDTSSPTITARTTRDLDADGRIDRLELTFSEPIVDATLAQGDFAVAGYTISGVASGASAGDAQVFLLLTEGGSADTAATPGVTYTQGTLADRNGNLLASDGSVVPATDGARPVLLTASWTDAGSAGVDAGDTIAIAFSEPVVMSGTTWNDVFALPVNDDTLATTALDTSAASSGKTLTIAGTALLTPGGSFSSGATDAGSASGLFIPVASQGNVIDGAGNDAVGIAASAAIDLGPTGQTISIAWSDGTTSARSWAIGDVSVATGYASDSVGASFVVRSAGTQPVQLTLSTSASSPAAWSVATTAALNAFELKADADGDAAATPGDRSLYELDLAAGTAPVLDPLLYSGTTRRMRLYVKTPTAVTVGGGSEQTVTVTVTASVP